MSTTPFDLSDHSHGSVVEQVHRVINSDHGLDQWALAEELVRFVGERTVAALSEPPPEETP